MTPKQAAGYVAASVAEAKKTAPLSRLANIADRAAAQVRAMCKLYPDLQFTVIVTNGHDTAVRQSEDACQRVDWDKVGRTLRATGQAVIEQHRTPAVVQRSPLPTPEYSAVPDDEPPAFTDELLERGPTPISKGWKESL